MSADLALEPGPAFAEAGSPEWAPVVTASKVAAILGVSPWQSQRSIWNVMAGLDPGIDSKENQRRGHYLEDGVLRWWSDQHPEFTTHVDQPWCTRPGLTWGAATPDRVSAGDGVAPVVVEAKTDAKSSDRYGQPGTDEVPIEVMAQTMWQLHVTGLRRAYVPVLGDRLSFEEYVIDYDPEMAADIEELCGAFVASVAAGDAPALDERLVTYESMRRVHPEIERGVKVPVGDRLARDLANALRWQDIATRRVTGVKSRLAEEMGSGHTAMYGGQVVARRQAKQGGVPYVVLVK